MKSGSGTGFSPRALDGCSSGQSPHSGDAWLNSCTFLTRTLAKYFQGIEVGDQQQLHVHSRDDVGKAEVSRVTNERWPQGHCQKQVGCADNVEDPHWKQRWLFGFGALQPDKGNICKPKADKVAKCRRIREARRRLRGTSPAMKRVVAKYREKWTVVRVFSCWTLGSCFIFGQIIVAKIVAQPISPAAAPPPK